MTDKPQTPMEMVDLEREGSFKGPVPAADAAAATQVGHTDMEEASCVLVNALHCDFYAHQQTLTAPVDAITTHSSPGGFIT
jgi:hypothetical protein